MGPRERRTVRAADHIEGREFATWVSSWIDPWEDSVPIVAERAMYFDHGGVKGGHQSVGVPEPGYDWYFAEGYTGPGFEEYICVYNPAYVGEARAKLELIDEEGNVSTYPLTLPQSGRVTVRVNDLAPGRNVSAHVEAVDNLTIVAERSIYFDYADGRRGGSVSPGVSAPGERWYLAEGYCGD